MSCDFCRDSGVINAASWLDDEPRPPVQCPVCGLRHRFESEPCARCGQPIGPGYLYAVGPPPEHVACP